MSGPASERIIEATLTLLAEHGVAGLTMSAIAARAEVARQTLYNHYPDVEAVVYAATSVHQEESIAQLAQVLSTIESPSARLEHLVRHHAAIAAHGHLSVRGAFSPHITELLAAHDQQILDLIAAALRDGVDRGEFRSNLDIRRDGLLLHRLLEGVAELAAGNTDATAEIVTTAVRSALGMVGR